MCQRTLPGRSLRPAVLRSLFLVSRLILFLSLGGGRCVGEGLVRADALVLVNSSSPGFPGFEQRIQPYLDNFGVPYTVLDLSSHALDPSVGDYALVILGHKLCCTNLDEAAQSLLTTAVRNGTGLVNFDSELEVAGVGRYRFVQDIFGFGYAGQTNGTFVYIPSSGPNGTLHFITSLHSAGDRYEFLTPTNITFTRLVLSNSTELARSQANPLLVASSCGLGRAVQWASYDWMASYAIGPFKLDDLLWRSLVWAARKPFVLRALPPFVTMRMDDVSGDDRPEFASQPFWWATIANDFGFKPWLGLFLDYITPAKAMALRELINRHQASANIHAFNQAQLVYFDHSAGQSLSDAALAKNITRCTNWLADNAIPPSPVLVAHYGELGTNVAPGLHALNVQYPDLKSYPGTPQSAGWLKLGPYRCSDPPQRGDIAWPTWYADFLTVPGHPEFLSFFNCVAEMRNPNGCLNEWCPSPLTDSTNINQTIRRGARDLKDALNSFALATLFTHEFRLVKPPYPGTDTNVISPDLWRTLLQGVTSNLAPYQPLYVTLDEACQYVRATRTSRLTATLYDPASGELHATYSGNADVETSLNIYFENQNGITNVTGTVAPFQDGTNAVVLTPAPAQLVLTPPAPTLPPFASLRFTPLVLDQLDRPMPTNLPIQWSASGGGAIDPTGSFTAGAQLGGPFLVTATAPGLAATAAVTVACSGPVLRPNAEFVAAPLRLLSITNTAIAPAQTQNFTTNRFSFNYTNRTQLLEDGWSFIATTSAGATRNTEITNPVAKSVVYDPGCLRVPCDVGDLWEANATTRNSLFRALPGNWVSLVATMDFAPTANFSAAHLTLYRDDDNYLQVGRAFNNGHFFMLPLELNGTAAILASQASAETHFALRLGRADPNNTLVQASWQDSAGWHSIGAATNPLTTPRLALWAGGAPTDYSPGAPTMDLRALEITTLDILPKVLTYALLEAPAGARIDTNGIISWTPTLDQASSVNWLTTLVSDNSFPPQTATNRLLVRIQPALAAWPTDSGLQLSWSAALTNYLLETTTNLDRSSVWVPVADTPATSNEFFHLAIPASGAQQFFRLRP